MRFSALEEYGLRCVLQMAQKEEAAVTTIVELAEKEGLSSAYVGKVMHRLKKGGIVQSLRGQSGGYRLVRPPKELRVGEVLRALGGHLYGDDFCEKHSGDLPSCVHSVDCALRAVWRGVNVLVERYLNRFTLKDLLEAENHMAYRVQLDMENAQTLPVGVHPRRRVSHD